VRWGKDRENLKEIKSENEMRDGAAEEKRKTNNTQRSKEKERKRYLELI
jgi:hypothetical protein